MRGGREGVCVRVCACECQKQEIVRVVTDTRTRTNMSYAFVLILLECVLILLYMCPHTTTMHLSSYTYICVLILLYMCPIQNSRCDYDCHKSMWSNDKCICSRTWPGKKEKTLRGCGFSSTAFASDPTNIHLSMLAMHAYIRRSAHTMRIRKDIHSRLFTVMLDLCLMRVCFARRFVLNKSLLY